MAEAPHRTEPAYDIADEYRPEPPPVPEPPFWQDGSFRIGIHTSIAGDLVRSLETASKLGCNALQIFSSSPRMWPGARGRRIPEAEASRFRQRREELRLAPLVIHDNYLINLAASEPVMRARSIQAFRDELIRARALGADFLVAHPGSSGGASAAEAIARIARALRQAAIGHAFDGLRILLENTAGMGTSVGARFEELAAILDATGDLPVGICLDTAHLFAAGFDVRAEHGLERALVAIDRAVGLERVAVIHVNDSKTALGSRVDRHEHIGKGRIGLEGFRRILNHPFLAPNGAAGLPGRAFILETPIDRPGDDRRNVRTLWKLVGVSVPQVPRAKDGFSMPSRKAKTQRRRGAQGTKAAGRVRRS